MGVQSEIDDELFGGTGDTAKIRIKSGYIAVLDLDLYLLLRGSGLSFWGCSSFRRALEAPQTKGRAARIRDSLAGSVLQPVLTSMAVTAIIAIILDNLLPGATRAERGLEVWEKEASDEAWEKAEAAWDAMEEGEMRPV